MDPVNTALLGLTTTLIGVLIWALKTLITRLFGTGRDDKGVVGAFLEDLEENTEAIRELRDYQKQHARALNDLTTFLREETARGTAAETQ